MTMEKSRAAMVVSLRWLLEMLLWIRVDLNTDIYSMYVMQVFAFEALQLHLYSLAI